MSDEEKSQFYSKIPLFMHYFPHLHVWQQRAAMAQKQQEELSEAQTAADAMRQFFASPEGAEKVTMPA